MPLAFHQNPTGGRLRAARIVALLLALPLGACATKPETTGSIYPNDYRDRHPITLTDAPRIIDLFVEGPTGLSGRSRQDLADFLREYHRSGSGPLIAQVPTGFGTNPGTRVALSSIRAEAPNLSVSPYSPTDPTVASPIRLSFKRLQAKVSGKCGLWPDDLGVSDARSNWQNQQYWNFGCASQSNLASQVADPNDLVRGRHETRPDTGRRMYNFGQIRSGKDPSTEWKQQNTSVTQGISQ